MLRSERGLLRTVAALPGHLTAGPERRFWLIVGLITLGGAILRAQMHDFGLPWFDSSDELELWYIVRDLRGMPVKSITYPGPYPPLMLWLHQLVQPLAESRGSHSPADAVLDLRRLVLVFNALGAIGFAMLGRRCGGALAGVIAAALWALEPALLRVTVYAISESLIIPLQILAILLAVHSLESNRRRWLALVSIALGVLCFLGDYRFLVAVIPGIGALMWLLWRHVRPNRRLALLWYAGGLALVSVTGTLVLPRLPERFQTIAREALRNHLWDFESFFLFLGESMALIHPAFPVLFLVLVLLTLRTHRAPLTAALSTPALLMVGATMILTPWAITSIRAYGDASLDKLWLRYQLPALLMIYLLLATAVAQLLPRIQGSQTRILMNILFVASLLFFLFLPSLYLVQDYRVPPWPLIVRRWFDDNLESSTILIYEDSRWFNPVGSGIPHRVWFDTWKTDDILDKPLQVWIDDYHLTWALIPATLHDRQLRNDEEGQAMLDQMLLVREFTAPPVRRYFETILYRLWRMQHETDIRFGDHIRLTGYDLHSPDPPPASPLEFTLYWNAATTPPDNYSLFLHLIGADDPRLFAQVDGNPAVPARLTQTWDRPEETLISPRFSLPLPDELPPGDYRVMLGLYNFETGERLPVRDASGAPLGDAWELLRLGVPGQ